MVYIGYIKGIYTIYTLYTLYTYVVGGGLGTGEPVVVEDEPVHAAGGG
jgi:hypothetical protein